MGELSPVTLSSYGVGKLVSVLVSVADSLPPKSLPHTRLEMEARVGIEPTPKFQGRMAFWPTAAPMPAAGGDAGAGAGLNLHPGIPLAKLLVLGPPFPGDAVSQLGDLLGHCAPRRAVEILLPGSRLAFLTIRGDSNFCLRHCIPVCIPRAWKWAQKGPNESHAKKKLGDGVRCSPIGYQ